MTGSEGRFPKSLIEFQGRFATESACAEYLFARRWPEGFVCPGCGDGRAWLLKAKAFTYECAACGRQTSVTAGTIIRPGLAERWQRRLHGPPRDPEDG